MVKIKDSEIKDHEYFSKRGVEKYNNNDFAEAIEDFDKAIQLDPENSYYFNLRGHAKYSSGDSRGARSDFNKAKKLKTKSKRQRKLMSI